jgi:hypothetical protein
MKSRLRHNAPYAAIVLALIAIFVSVVGASNAGKSLPGPSLKPKKYGLLRLDKKKHFPTSVLPTVRNSNRVGKKKASDLTATCAADTVDLGSWCLLSAPVPVTKEDTGKNNYFFATQSCVEQGGYLPTAAQLIGAADRVKLVSTIDDSELTAAIDMDKTDGLKDRREMSATLTTTASGGTAAGSEGVTEGSRGDPKQNEPDPVPQPANPSPATLAYVTVYDNHDHGGFAGAQPVGQPIEFRCGFNKQQGQKAAETRNHRAEAVSGWRK